MEKLQRTCYYKQHLCMVFFMIRICIVLVSLVCSLLIPKDAQPVAASQETSDLEIESYKTSECLEGAPQLAIDWSFIRDDANSKQLQVMIALDTCMLIELLTDLSDVDVRQNMVTVADLYRALNRNNPKRLHDIAMLLLKKLCETNYADTDQDGGSNLKDNYSVTLIREIESDLKRDYIALFQAYMFTAVIHNFGDVWFAMCCRKAFNLAEAHEDLERKDLVTQFVLRTHFSSNNPGKIERTLRQNAIQSQDDRFWNHIRSALEPLPYPHPYQHHLCRDSDSLQLPDSPPPYNRDCVSAEAGADVAGTYVESLPTYEEAKKAMGLDAKPIENRQ